MGTISPHHHLHHHHSSSSSTQLFTTKFISRAIYILIPLALLHFYLSPLPLISLTPTNPSPLNVTSTNLDHSRRPSPAVQRPRERYCNYAEGRWAPRDGPPPYNATTCGGIIKDGQNCMAHGRPDTGYLRWRWQPDHCRLPRFNPLVFLALIENKHLAFVGDSMARNQLESLLCLLSSSSPPTLVHHDGEERKFRRWAIPSHNATVSVLWSPFLVKGVEKSAGLDHNKLHLDSADERWASELRDFDVVVFSIGHWFLHPAVYYEGGSALGCHNCPAGFNRNGAGEIGFFGAFRKAIRTALMEVTRRANNASKLAVVTTFSPAHFEGEWDRAGACAKEEPYKEGEKEMEYMDAEMRKIQLEEVAAAAAAAAAAEEKTLLKLEGLDVTRMALMRPDGHPGPYMYPNPFAEGPKERVQNDCVHWCLPGPIDAWNDILLQIVRRWTDESMLR